MYTLAMQRVDGTPGAHTRTGSLRATHAAAEHMRADAFSLHASRVFHPRRHGFTFAVVVVAATPRHATIQRNRETERKRVKRKQRTKVRETRE